MFEFDLHSNNWAKIENRSAGYSNQNKITIMLSYVPYTSELLITFTGLDEILVVYTRSE